MVKVLNNKLIRTGLILTTLLMSTSGCASFYEDPFFRTMYGTPQEILPSWLQTQGYKEYKANEKRERIVEELINSGRYEKVTNTIWKDKETGKLFYLD